MLLQASTSWLTALVAMANSVNPPPGHLRLVSAISAQPIDDKPFDNTPVQQGLQAPLSDAQIAALINTAGRTFSNPEPLVGPLWIRIPVPWVQALAGAQASAMPTSDPLQLSQDCGADIQGARAAAFQAIGFTAYTPATNGPWPAIAG